MDRVAVRLGAFVDFGYFTVPAYAFGFRPPNASLRYRAKTIGEQPTAGLENKIF